MRLIMMRAGGPRSHQALPYTGITTPELIVSDRLQWATINSAMAVGLTQVSCLAVGMSLRLAGVSRVDGASAMAEMSSFFSSSANATVKAATAAFDAV